jgi:quinol monooxygenase YgiN
MVMTILEAQVDPSKWEAMRQSYTTGSTELPPQMAQTFLLQSASDPTIWRMASVWKSREALDEYRQSVETPGGVLFFRSVGAEPTLSIFDVAAHAAAPL